MLTLALLSVLAADPDGGCAWKEPKNPGKVAPYMSNSVEFLLSADPSWFRCAKRAGGKLELIWSVGEGGQLNPLEPVPLTSYGSRETTRELCAVPGLRQVQAQVKGSGEMAKLDWSSNVIEVFCPRCQWAGDDNMLALHTQGFSTPKGMFTIDATFHPRWYECARKGSALELRLFAGADAAEVRNATQPTHVIKGLAGPKVKKSFSPAAICKSKPKVIGYEFGGTGEFLVLPPKGRAIQQVSCP